MITEQAKEALGARVERIKEHTIKIQNEVLDIRTMILPDCLNAAPDARVKKQISKRFNPMLLDLWNGLEVITQGLKAADEIIEG